MYKRFLSVSLLLLTFFLTPSIVSAQESTLHPNYTIQFSIVFNRVPHDMKDVAKEKQRGTVLVSSDGQHLLYKMQVGEWQDIVIYNRVQETTAAYNTTGMNSLIRKEGIGRSIASMRYLPFPAVGFEDVPFVKSMDCAAQHPLQCTGQVIVTRGFGMGDSVVYNPQEMIVRSQWKGKYILSDCIAKIPPRANMPHGGVRSRWQFSDFDTFQSLPIARTIVYKENKHVKKADGTEPLEPDGSVTFTLIRADNKALPASEYDIASYLSTNKNIVMDNTTKKGTGFFYDPRKGNLEQQRDASLQRDKLIEMSQGTPIQNNPNQTGGLILIALILASASGFVWYYVRRKNKS